MPKRKLKTKTRANGEGSVYKREVTRKDGSTFERWEGKATTGYTPEGKRKRRTLYGRTQAEVLQKLEVVKRQLASGIFSDTTMTLEQYLERWHVEKAREVKPRTIQLYREQAERHIIPHIGSVQLAKLAPMHLQNLVGMIADSVGKRTANLVRVQLHSSLKQAVRWQLIPRNPTEAVAPIKVQKKPVVIWTPTEAAKFLDAARPHRLYALYYLAMSTGLRRGELLGLEWSHIKAGRLEVTTSKTRKGIRTIKLSKDVVDTLKAHRIRQEGERHALDNWPDNDLVFSSKVGTPQDPRNLERDWHDLQILTRREWLEALNTTLESEKLSVADREHYETLKGKLEAGKVFPRIRLHDLRHLHASMMIKAKKTPLEVAERLGHTNPSFTLDTYGHLFREHQEEDEVSILEYLPKLGTAN